MEGTEEDNPLVKGEEGRLIRFIRIDKKKKEYRIGSKAC